MSMFNIPVIYYRFEIQIFSYLRLYVIVMEREDIKFYQPVFEHLSTVHWDYQPIDHSLGLSTLDQPIDYTGIINLSNLHWDYQP